VSQLLRKLARLPIRAAQKGTEAILGAPEALVDEFEGLAEELADALAWTPDEKHEQGICGGSHLCGICYGLELFAKDLAAQEICDQEAREYEAENGS
jgi:hypothetical protein